jgi:ankyrin repeat protein
MAAVEEGKTEMVTLLLERGAEVNVTDLAGITPLERAQNRGFKDIIKLLVEHGASTVVEEKPRE